MLAHGLDAPVGGVVPSPLAAGPGTGLSGSGGAGALVLHGIALGLFGEFRLAGIHNALDLGLQAAAAAQGEQLGDDGQGTARHNGAAQADHVVVVKVAVGLHSRPVGFGIQPVHIHLPAIGQEGLLKAFRDLFGVLCHGGV